MNRDIRQVEEFVRVGNNDARMEGAAPGQVCVCGDYCFVREDDWLAMLALVVKHKLGSDASRKFIESVAH